MWGDVICYLTKTELLLEIRTLLSTEPSSELNSTEVTINVRICTKMILRLSFQFEIQVRTAASSLVCHFLFKRVSSKCISINWIEQTDPDRIERREVCCLYMNIMFGDWNWNKSGHHICCLCLYLYVVHSTTRWCCANQYVMLSFQH